jgi:hypothetical protein
MNIRNTILHAGKTTAESFDGFLYEANPGADPLND